MATNAIVLPGCYTNGAPLLLMWSNLVNAAKDAGLVDSDVVVDTFAELVTAVETRRDAIGITPQGKAVFNMLIGALYQMKAFDLLDDTAAAALTTVSGTSANTDLRYNITSQAQWDATWSVTSTDFFRAFSAGK